MNRAVWLGPVLLLLLVGVGMWRVPDPPPSAAGDGTSPRRIISLAPSLTEIVLALERGDRLVGVTRFCAGVDPAVARVGDLRFDLEAILDLDPDRVIAIESRAQADLRRVLASRGIAIDVIPAESVADVRTALRRLGTLLEAADAANAWIDRIDSALEIPADPPISGLFVVERGSMIVAGGGSFIDTMMRAAGIANIYGAENRGYLRVELESVIERDPVIILDASFTEERGQDEFWGRFPSLRAVREGAVRSFPPVLPGVGIPAWVERLREEARARRE